MFSQLKPDRKWSFYALWAGLSALVLAFVFSFADALMQAKGVEVGSELYIFWRVWFGHFEYMLVNIIYAATVLFVGAKFFETRTILTIGFDQLDANNVLIKDPDGDNVVWVGRRYGNKFEAEAVATSLRNRLEESRKAG
jgi:hypothetical protein